MLSPQGETALNMHIRNSFSFAEIFQPALIGHDKESSLFHPF